MSKQPTIRNLCRSAVLVAASCLLVSVASCRKDDGNAERPDRLSVYLSLDKEPLDVQKEHVLIGARGGDYRLFVRTNVDFTPIWQDGEATPWAKVVRCEKTADDLYELDLRVNKRYSYAYYTKRTGMLMLSSPENDFGTFITVDQGMDARLSNNFSWLKYGTSDPRKMDGTPIDQWSNTLKGYGYTSTVPDGEEQAYCYGKNGYIMLGSSEGHGADFITPYVEAFRTDSLLVLSFRAVAFTSLEGVKDANRLTVQILGGGVLSDRLPGEEVTEFSFEVPYYDMDDETFPASMWEGTDYMVFIQSTDKRPLTSDTQVRFIAGELGQNPSCSRIFLDNLYIRVPGSEAEFHQYYSENSGSGPDRILGVDEEKE